MARFRNFAAIALIAVAAGGLAWFVSAQEAPNPAGNPFIERVNASLREPFVGLTTDGRPVPGLYSIRPTGVSTVPVMRAAQDLLGALTQAQREKMLFAVDDSEWRNWANIHRFPRQGVSVAEMTAAQREAAHGLLKASLSAKGYTTTRDIMRLNHHLAELVDNFDEYGEYLYWFTIMGTPSADQPWGWQLDGHHLIINYFVLGDQVVMTPTFMGSEPVSATSGKYEGTIVLQAEQDLGLEFMLSLRDEQRKAATIEGIKPSAANRAEMARDNVVIPYQGVSATTLDAIQRRLLIQVIGAFVGNMQEGHAAVRMEEVLAHLDATWFAWQGSSDPDGAFYYRIHSPVIFIEFDHQGPVALGGARGVATRRHVHTVVRTPNGNDYGRDLLREHHEAHKDDPDHGHDHVHQ